MRRVQARAQLLQGLEEKEIVCLPEAAADADLAARPQNMIRGTCPRICFGKVVAPRRNVRRGAIYVSLGVLFTGEKDGFLGGGRRAVKYFEQLRP